MELYDLLACVIEAFDGLQIPYLVTGSVASMAYGEPRLTNDIDIQCAAVLLSLLLHLPPVGGSDFTP